MTLDDRVVRALGEKELALLVQQQQLAEKDEEIARLLAAHQAERPSA